MSFALANFPAEILGLILSNPSYSYLVITLWKCGNAALNVKLSKCITHVVLRLHEFVGRLRANNSSLESRAFPRLLSSLENLRHFSVSSSIPRVYRLGTAHSPRRELLELPPSLETLEVSSLDSELFLIDLPVETMGIGGGYDVDWSAHAIETKYERGTSKMINLGALFPKLSTLSLKGADLALREGDLTTFQNEDFAALPDTLTKLGWTSIWANNTDAKLWWHLPRSLTELDAKVLDSDGIIDLTNRFNPNSFSCLPHLASIGAYVNKNSAATVHLPQTITRCETTISKNPVGIRALPVSITSKVIISRFESPTTQSPWTAFIPAHLTTLKIKNSEMLGDHVSQLPWTLTDLELKNTTLNWNLISTMADSGVSFWPVNWKLTKLALTNIRRLEAYSIVLLPKTLTDLYLESRYGFEHDTEDDDELRIAGSDFPPILETLRLDLDLILSLKPATRSLPRTLKYLECDGRNLSIASLSLLPDSLTFLQFLGPGHNDDDGDEDSDGNDDSDDKASGSGAPPRLPSQLRSLYIDSWSFGSLDALPRSLTVFNINRFTDFRVPQSDPFSALPPTLTALKVEKLPETRYPYRFPATCFSTLQQLESLHFAPDDAAFPDEVLKTLSRKLKTLNLRIDSLTSKGAAFLPPRLVSTDFGYKITWTPEIVGHWPMASSKSNALPANEQVKVYQRHCDLY